MQSTSKFTLKAALFIVCGTHPALEAGGAVAAHEASQACVAVANNADGPAGATTTHHRVAPGAPMFVLKDGQLGGCKYAVKNHPMNT